MSLPTITIEGNLADEPTIRKTQQGKSVCTFTVISNKSKPDGNGGWQKVSTCSLRVTAFDDMADNCASSLHKGYRVIVVGEISDNNYEKDGVTRYSKQMVASDVGASLRTRTVTVNEQNQQATWQQANPQPAQPTYQQDPWSMNPEPEF